VTKKEEKQYDMIYAIKRQAFQGTSRC